MENFDCKKIVKYQGEFISKGRKITRTIHGIQTRKGYIHENISYNKFERKDKKIPEGFVKKTVNKKWVSEYACGEKKELKNDNPQYQKIKEKLKGYKKYFTIDNGGNAYLVYYNKEEVYVYNNNKIDIWE
jgi:hypothetical protein